MVQFLHAVGHRYERDSQARCSIAPSVIHYHECLCRTLWDTGGGPARMQLQGRLQAVTGNGDVPRCIGNGFTCADTVYCRRPACSHEHRPLRLTEPHGAGTAGRIIVPTISTEYSCGEEVAIAEKGIRLEVG